VAFETAGVVRRGAAVSPLVEDVSRWSTGRRMARYVVEALPLATTALAGALAGANVDAGALGLLVVTSCTGYATPGLDVLLARDLTTAASMHRLLVGHVGCHAALPALAVARDFVETHAQPAAVVCVELPSLHLQPPTRDLGQAVVHALFGDAAAAVVVAAEAVTGPTTRSRVHFDLVDVTTRSIVEAADQMTWNVTDTGFRMSLSRRVPDVVGAHVGPVVDELLARHGVARHDVAAWAVHPGGPRVLEVVEDRLGLPGGALDASRATLAEHGNCSSATILVVLELLARDPTIPPGAAVVALAFGPGLTLCAALLRAS